MASSVAPGPQTVAVVRSNIPALEARSSNVIAALVGNPRFRVVYVGWDRSGLEATGLPEQVEAHIYTKKAGFGLGALVSLLRWSLWAGRTLRGIRPDRIYACNVEAGLAGLFVPKKARAVYDIWDTFGGMLGMDSGPVAVAVNALERSVAKRYRRVYVPDPERTEQLQAPRSLRKRIRIVPNCQPLGAMQQKVVEGFSKPLRLLYTGTLVQAARGLEDLIDEVSQREGLYSLDIYGYGPGEPDLRNRAVGKANITFYGAGNRQEIEKALGACDVVVSLLNPQVPNYRYATSTKVFEAFRHQKPVLTTKDTATGRLVTETQWGVVAEYGRTGLRQALDALPQQSFVLSPDAVKQYDWNTYAGQVCEDIEKSPPP